MRKIALIFSLVFFIFSCSSGDQLPKGVLPKQKMQDVMWDLVQATEYLNAYVLNSDSVHDKTARALTWYDNVYRLHHTSKAEFDKSYAYYRDHPVLMKEVLDSLAHKKSPATLKPAVKDSVQTRDSQVKKRILMPGKPGIFPSVDTSRGRKRLRMR